MAGHPKFDFHTANTAWAFATASHRAPRLFDAVAREAARARTSSNLKNWYVSRYCAHSLHTHRRTRPGPSPPVAEMTLLTPKIQRQLFDNIARAAYKRLDRFSDQGLSNIAWAFAAAGEAQRHEKLFGAVASEAAPRVAEFQPQGFSNLAWAFSTAELSSSELFTAMASEIAKQNRAARFNPQEIANTAWAFAKNAEGSKQLFDSLATMTLVLGAKSGGDLTRAGFTPQELVGASVPDISDNIASMAWNRHAIAQTLFTRTPAQSNGVGLRLRRSCGWRLAESSGTPW